MDLIIVGNYTPGVRETAAWVENTLGNRIGPAFAATVTSSILKTIVFFPTIYDPKVIQRDDHISYKRSEPAAYLSMNIPYDPWMQGGKLERMDLFTSALCRGIGQIKGSRLSESDRNLLIRAAERACSELKSELS